MSVKIALSGISGFLDLALLPIKSALGPPVQSPIHSTSRKVILITETPDGVSLENSVCLGELDVCQTVALELMQAKRRLAFEGFQLEEVAALCFNNDYRWRFDDRPDKRLRFIIDPGPKSLPPNDESQ